MKLLLKIGAGVVALLVLALVAFNLLISADAVRDRVAARVKEQTGRELTVNGSTSLLLMPSPHIVLTDVQIVDPENRAGADLKVARLALDVSYGQLFSREVDAKRVVMERPVFTVRLKPQAGKMEQQGDAGSRHEKHAAAPLRVIAAGAAFAATRRDIRLDDVEIENGTVRIIYDENGAERRIEKINANLSLPHLVDPLTAKGDFVWKGIRVGFDLKLTSPADLETRSARLDLALDTDAIDANFGGNVATKPAFSAEGDLTAKSQSVPSLLAWMRRPPPTETAVGSGELSSHIAWQPGEISFTQVRFALSHATGQGQAVVTLKSPRPHLRAALALETLDLNPLLASNGAQAAPQAPSEPAPAASDGAAPAEPSPSTGSGEKGDNERAATQSGEAQGETAAPSPEAASPKADRAAAPAPPNVAPAAFDADVNVNVHETKVLRMTIGPSSVSLSLRDGVLDANLAGMQLYDGQGSGKFTLDASKPVPTFAGNLSLDGVSAQPLLNGAAGFNLLAGRTKIALALSGTGGSEDEIKHSLAGQGSIEISDGSVEGINLTELIQGVGAGQMPNLEQGPGAKTTFSSLGGSFNIASGVAETHDLEMTSPLLKVTGRGTVDVVTSSLDFLTQPEIVAGPEGKGGAGALAGLSIPVRIEGPFDRPTFKPEIKGMFSSPEQASKTINQIGDVLQKKLKGKPVGEAIGRILGGVRIGTERGNGGGGQSAKPPANQEEPDEEAPPEESDQGRDPDLDNILR
jgi:AsmA protein